MSIDCNCPPKYPLPPLLKAKYSEYAPAPDRYEVDDYILTLEVKEFPKTRLAEVTRKPTLEERFRSLANEWSSKVGNVSSITVMTSHPKYKEIINLGWDVVPFLLSDLRQGRGFWFDALDKITGIRPFDPKDAGNFKRMTKAWVNWGQWKELI